MAAFPVGWKLAQTVILLVGNEFISAEVSGLDGFIYFTVSYDWFESLIKVYNWPIFPWARCS